MHHNSIFEVLLSHPDASLSTAQMRTTPSALSPSKRYRDDSSMSSSPDRPKLVRPPSHLRPTIQMPQQSQQITSTSTSPKRRPNPARSTSSTQNPLHLQLPEVHLGRYHPINFPSQSSSIAGTPSTGLNSPQPPVSPRTHQRQLSEAERRLHEYYRDRAIVAGQAGSLGAFGKPSGPKLEPAGSPGPVTPLELEASNSYFGVKMGGLGSPVRKSPDRGGCQGAAMTGMSPRTPPIGSY